MLTPVILVCVHDLEENLSINHSLLYSMFSSYGTIQRILIFERSNTIKSFIEFDNAQSALEARKKLNRAMLFDGKYRISIYPSNLQEIKFQNNFPGGVDYTLLRKTQGFDNNMGNNMQTYMQPMMSMSPEMYYNDNYLNYQVNSQPKKNKHEGGSSKSSSSSSSYPHSEHEGSFDEDDILRRVNRHQKETKVYDSETAEMGSEREDNEEVEDFNNLINAFSNPGCSFSLNQSFQEKVRTGTNNSSSCSFMKQRRLPCFPLSQAEISSCFENYSFSNHSISPANSEHSLSRLYSMEDIPSVLDHTDEKVSQPLPAALEASLESAYQTDGNLCNISSDRDKVRPSQLNDSQPAASDKREEEKNSPVLHVLGIESKEVTARMLFNVFSNFGNILKLIFIKTRAVALIEFECSSSAKIAKDSLNNVGFMGKPLRITFSKYQTIQLEPGQNEKYPEQLIIGDQNNSRFREGRTMVIAQPSTTLHISNLTKEICKDKKAISNYLGAYGEIKGIKSLLGENGKNMCLVRMKSVEDCLQAMAHLHDTELGGRKIQISFSRSKI